MRLRLAAVALLFGLAPRARAQAGGDSVYSSAALRSLVADAASRNRAPPPALRGYRAAVETEIGFVLRDTLGREYTTQVEQLAATASWERDGDYDLHVVGYRSQSVGVPFSALGLMRSWSVPTLYGDRLDVGLDPTRGPASRRGGRHGADSVHAVHPLASDRDAYYRFDGGDTVVTLRTASGATPIVRVRVTPRVVRPDVRLALFDGEIDIDPVRLALVRMRGRLLVEGRAAGGRPLIARLPGLVAAAYMELVNGQLEGEYWLPTYQRTELQANFALLGENRSIFRIVSHFGAHVLDVAPDGEVVGDSARHHRRSVTFAPRDSLDGHSGWQTALGATTASVNGADFDDLAPPAWRTALPRSRVHLYPRKLDDVFRYDRVEGAYTGASLTAESRDASGARSARVFGGWAWLEQTARGGASVGVSRRGTAGTLRVERQLASTNDFAGALSGGATLGALFGIDDADYVDRRLVTLDLTRALGARDAGYVQLELGAASDRPDSARLTRGLLLAGSGFRPNRGVARGRYARAAATLELNPSVTGILLDPGIGFRLHGETAEGELRWSRVEATLTGRRGVRDVVLQARLGAGAVFGRAIPPQQLFELGQNEDLAGYGYKEFGGDRATVGHLRASYTAPLLRRPHRVWRTYFIPGLSPGVAAGIDGGWAGAASAAARQALLELGTTVRDGVVVPVSRPTGTARASVDLRVTAFGGGVSLGVARPVDHRAPWRLVVGIGQ